MNSVSFFFRHNKVVLGMKTATIALAILAVYYQDLVMLGSEALGNESINYIFVIPFILGYSAYRKRKVLRAVAASEASTALKAGISPDEFVGLMLCFLAVILYWHGSYTFYPLEYHMISMPVFVAGAVLAVFNTRTLKALAFPIVFLFLLAPLPLSIVQAAGISLSTLSSKAACTILKTMGLPVSLVAQYGYPTIILERTASEPLTFVIDVACAGIYSLIGFTIFAVFVSYIARGSLWRKLATFLAGFPLIYSLNITRIVIIVLIGKQYGMEAALEAFHLLGGWALIFAGTMILLTLSEKIVGIRLFSKPTSLSCKSCDQNTQSGGHFCRVCGRLLDSAKVRFSRRDLTKLAILAISVIMIVNLQLPVFALTEELVEVNIQALQEKQTTTQILPSIAGYSVQFLSQDKEFAQMNWQDVSLTYAYIPHNNSEMIVWVTVEIAEIQSVLHRWEGCLPRVTQFSLRDVQLLLNPPITARFFAFREGETTPVQIVLYWYEKSLFNTGSKLEQKHVKISLITFTNTSGNIQSTEDELLPLGKAIANHWQPIKAGALISLTIGYHGIPLMVIASVLLLCMTLFQLVKQNEEKKANFQVFNKLASKEKLVFQAVNEASKKGQPTITAIASRYYRLSKENIELDILLGKLERAQKLGLVKEDIVNRDDEPILTWKSQIKFPRNHLRSRYYDPQRSAPRSQD